MGVALVGLVLVRARFADPSANPFDSIVTKRLIRSACEKRVGFELDTRRDGDRFVYEARFDVGTHDPEFFYLVTVTVARAGELLSREKYRQTRENIEEQDAGKPPDSRIGPYMFPAIGKRAFAGVAFLGPGGGGGAVVFTTSDEAFDVAVSLENKLRDGLVDPSLTCLAVAQKINRQYDQRR